MCRNGAWLTSQKKTASACAFSVQHSYVPLQIIRNYQHFRKRTDRVLFNKNTTVQSKLLFQTISILIAVGYESRRKKR